MSIVDNLRLDLLADHWSRICKHELDLMTKLKESFGDRFDGLNFLNFETGQFMKGAELRDCQTGCEMLKKRGFHKHGSFSELQQCGCKQFDEQLCFESEDGKPLSNVDYCITRADGMKVKGTTDNEGKTKRIKNTQQEMAIKKVEFFASECTPFCPKTGIHPGMMLASIGLSDIKTNQENIGSSVKKVTLKGKYRQFTSGEIAMTKLVFKESINYGMVKVYNDEILPVVQKKQGNIMVAWGDLYCTEKNFREDYSTDKNDDMKVWFMHEMTHVWQKQLGYAVEWHGAWAAITGQYSNNEIYEYKGKGKNFSDFNFEQQGEIISHHYAAKYLRDIRYSPLNTFYEVVLKDFLRNPKDAKHLPK